MINYLSRFILVLIFTVNISISAQDAEDDAPEVSTVEALLQLVKEGKTKEQSENAKREARFLADKSKQASILAAEKRELVRQEKIADQLEPIRPAPTIPIFFIKIPSILYLLFYKNLLQI